MNKNNLNKFYLFLFAALLLLIIPSCSTTGKPEQRDRNSITNTKLYSCTPTQLFRCEPEKHACKTIPVIKTHSNKNFQIIIDLKKLHVKSLANEKIISESGINSVQEIDSLIYMTGQWVGFDKAYRSWNAILDQKNGQLYSTSITTGAGHIVYGECHEQ